LSERRLCEPVVVTVAHSDTVINVQPRYGEELTSLVHGERWHERRDCTRHGRRPQVAAQVVPAPFDTSHRPT
jgi:hypothetical protein